MYFQNKTAETTTEAPPSPSTVPNAAQDLLKGHSTAPNTTQRRPATPRNILNEARLNPAQTPPRHRDTAQSTTQRRPANRTPDSRPANRTRHFRPSKQRKRKTNSKLETQRPSSAARTRAERKGKEERRKREEKERKKGSHFNWPLLVPLTTDLALNYTIRKAVKPSFLCEVEREK